MSDILVDKTSAILKKVLDGASVRQRVLANNIANVETPGFTRQQLSFEDELHAAMDQPSFNPETQIEAVERVALDVTSDTVTPARDDGNNVQIEREMTDMAKNSLQYETAAKLLTMKMRGMRDAIFDGRR